MDVNYFPGRLRIRDKIFKDEEIRAAVLKVLDGFNANQTITYNEKTGSLLIIYDKDKIDESKFKRLESFAKNYAVKIMFYEPSKKQEILDGIKEAGERILKDKKVMVKDKPDRAVI